MVEIFGDFLTNLKVKYIGGIDGMEIRLPKDLFDRFFYDCTHVSYTTHLNDPFNVTSFQFMGINIIRK